MGFKKAHDERYLPSLGLSNFISANTVKKWLALADFEMVKHDTLLFRPPLEHHDKLYQQLKIMEWFGSKLMPALRWGLYVNGKSQSHSSHADQITLETTIIWSAGIGPRSHVTELAMKHVLIFTDGACRGNPGPGGWGALLRYGSHEKKLLGAEADTTNNRMELMAAIQALMSLS